MDNKSINSTLSVVQKFYIEFMGSFIPGFVFLSLMTITGAFFCNVFFKFTFDKYFDKLSYVLSNWYAVTFLLVFAYIVGAVLHRKTPKRPDRIASFRQYCMSNSEERKYLAVQYSTEPPFSFLGFCKYHIKQQALKNAANKVENQQPETNAANKVENQQPETNVKNKVENQQPETNAANKVENQQPETNVKNSFGSQILNYILFNLFKETYVEAIYPNAGYPYPNLSNYLKHRKKDNLAKYVTWPDDEEKYDAKSKLAINDFKALIMQFGSDKQQSGLARNEAHIRLLTSIWYGMLYLKRVLLLITFVWVAGVLLQKNIPSRMSFIIFHDFSYSLIVGLLTMITAVSWIKSGIESSLHYVRTREVVLILESVFIIDHMNTNYSPAGKCLQKILNGKSE